MITFDNVSLRYGHREIYHNLSCMIQGQERIALVGPNGAGKTTFYRLITGEEQPDSGNVELSKDTKFGYLPQEQLVCKGRSLYEEVESVFSTVIESRKELEALEHSLADLPDKSDAYLAAIDKMGELEHRLEELEAHKIRSRVEKVLLGLGFKLSDLERDTGEFSGGWQMRMALARLLLMQPSILLLDEPTNHLDIVSQRWLETELKRYQGAIIIISHDQAFIDELCNRTFALSNGELETYDGNYSYFLKESVLRRELKQKAFDSQQRKIKKTEEFIDRFRYKATKAKQVQSRIKALGKVDRLDSGDERTQSVNFKFPLSSRSGQVVIKFEEVKKCFGDLLLFDNLDLQIERGEKIAIVGPNGCGKSTLARIMAEEETLTSGLFEVGHKVDIGFFAQQQADALDGNKDVISTLEESASNRESLHLRSILGAFLFSGDDVYKLVKVLSGGEKSRLALARILCTPSNCLILDEPTNHIDMNTKSILQEALLDYAGTCLIVSHDRGFLDPLVTRVIEVTQNRVRNFIGNVSDYLLKIEEEEQAAQTNSTTSSKSSTNKLSPRERRRKRAAIQLEINPLKKQLAQLETNISNYESKKESLEAQLCDESFFKQGDLAKTAVLEHQKIERKLQEAYKTWENVGEKITAHESRVSGYE